MLIVTPSSKRYPASTAVGRNVGRIVGRIVGWVTVAWVTAAWLVLAIVFAFTDLRISIALYDPGSGLAGFTDHFGEVPGLLMMLGAVVILNANRARRGPLGEAGATALMYVLFVAPLLYLLAIRERANGGLSAAFLLTPYFWPASLVAFVLVHTLTRVRHIRFSDSRECCARVTVWLILLGAAFVHSGKLCWGRVRFRDLAPGYAEFTPFYAPQGFSGHSSFPSGHAAFGWVLLPLLLLAIRSTARTQCVVLAGVCLWGLAVGLGRILLGAHYASDVLFSTGFTFVTFAILAQRYRPAGES